MDDDTAPAQGEQVPLRTACPPTVSEALRQLAATTPRDTEFEPALSDLAWACADAPAEAVLAAVVTAAAAPDARLRRAGIEGLGILGPDAVEHAPVVTAALSDPDSDVRSAAAGALRLVVGRYEPDEELRAAVRSAVEQTPGLGACLGR
jgi:HEAT repeat protein